MLCPMATEYWGSLYLFYFKMALPIVIAFYFYFRGFGDVKEIKLVYLFFVWYVITRILNGDVSLADEGDMVVNLAASAMLLPLCFITEGKEREKLLDLICAAASVFYTALGIISIYASLKQVSIPNPFSLQPDSYIVTFNYESRSILLDKNPNICCNWFFISFFMLVYEFIKQKNGICVCP